jgi:hypothetical protein
VRKLHQRFQLEHEGAFCTTSSVCILHCYGDDYADDDSHSAESKCEGGQGEVDDDWSGIERDAAENNLEKNVSRSKTRCRIEKKLREKNKKKGLGEGVGVGGKI